MSAIKPAARKKIEPRIGDIFTYRQLTRLSTDLLPETQLPDVALGKPDLPGLRAFFETYELRSLARDVAGMGGTDET